MGQHTVPRRAVTPGKAPPARGDDAGKTSPLVPRLADIAKPLPVVPLGVKVDEGGLAGQGGIRRPAVLLPMRTVGGIVMEIGQNTLPRDGLDAVGHGIRAGEPAPIVQLSVHHQVGQKVRSGLLRRDAVHADVAEAVVGKGGGVALGLTAPANVGVQMDDLLVPLPKVTNEPHVVQTDIPVLQRFRVAKLNGLPRTSRDRQTAHARVVLSEIVNICIPARENGHGSNLSLHRNGGHVRRPKLPRRGIGGKSRRPVRIVKTGEHPPPERRLPTGVVALAEAVIVPQKRRRSHLEGGIPREKHLTAYAKLQGHFGSRAEGGLVEVPDVAAGIVDESVAQDQSHGILPRSQRHLVLVKVHQVLGVGEVGRQESPRQTTAVEVQLVHTADRHPQSRGGLGIHGQLPTEAVSRHVTLKGIVVGGRTDIGLTEGHENYLLGECKLKTLGTSYGKMPPCSLKLWNYSPKTTLWQRPHRQPFSSPSPS